ncbi:hypothetical protein AGMMS49525_13820 [Bacteroidia bacterium]|nr:hypothetical protein AGMMS49525_13820 [Bacteroidia bacterium]
MKTKKQKKAQMRSGLFISAAVLLSAGLWTLSTAQVKIGGDPTTPVTTGAVLELDGASGGLLLPRVQVLPDTTLASEGTMYYQISDATVHILLIDGGVKRWEAVGSGGSISLSDIAAKANKLAFGIDSAKLAGIAVGANLVNVDNQLTTGSATNALSSAMGVALLDSIKKRSIKGDSVLNHFRDSVYTKAQTLGGNKTFSGTTVFSAISPTVPSRSAAAGNNATVLATEAQVALKANIASPTFTGTVSVPSKTAAATNSGTLVATEAQVFAVATAGSTGLNDFRDSVYNKAQTLNGEKTFDEVPKLPSQTAKYVLAAPNAANGVPAFRALVATDIPTLNQSTTGSAATATALSAGTDRTKLDGIATGATKNEPSTTAPKANSGATGSTGSETGFSRGDHVHPSQVQDNMTASTTLAPSVTAVNTALGNKMSSTQALNFTGDVTITTSPALITSALTTQLKNTGTPGTYGVTTTTPLTSTWGGTFSVPGFKTDAQGRVTEAGAHSVTIPSDTASSSAAGLMSSSKYALLSGNQLDSRFFVSPTTASGPPTFRNITATDIPSTINANTTGNANTVTSLAAARPFIITGGATSNSVNFDGSGGVTLNVTALDGSMVNSIDAAKITTGTVVAARLPQANSSTAGIISATDFLSSQDQTASIAGSYGSDAPCARKYGALATRVDKRLCYYDEYYYTILPDAYLHCAQLGMRLASFPASPGVPTLTEKLLELLLIDASTYQAPAMCFGDL